MSGITRRRFLTGAGVLAAGGVGLAAGLGDNRWWEWAPAAAGTPPPLPDLLPGSIEAAYYASLAGEGSLNCAGCHSPAEAPLSVSYCHTPHTGSSVRCNLCPHRCLIAAGERGTCRVRENRAGRLYSMVYGNPCAVHVDPIEKKPFFHFLPTAAAFSIATAGCNLRCLYCQNWSISQVAPEQTTNVDLPPAEVVRAAQAHPAPVIAYTYSEPSVFYEYVLATAQLGRAQGLRSAVISAGFINPEPLRALCAAVDAVKIDLKGFDADFYRTVCGGELAPVLEALRAVFQSGVHLEIVNLVVPTLNDRMDQLRALAGWVAESLGPDVPLHFSRFFPQYKLANLPPTPVETLIEARQVSMAEGLRFVYVGNVPGDPGNNTYCPRCGQAVIVRGGFAVLEYHLQGDRCTFCDERVPGVWWDSPPDLKPHYGAPGARDH